MDKSRNQKQLQTQSTPIAAIHRQVTKPTVKKAIFMQQGQADSQLASGNQRRSSKIVQSRYHLPTIQQSQQDKQTLNDKIHFLQHCLQQYKQQALSLASKLVQRQTLYKEQLERYEGLVQYYKKQLSELQRQLKGQNQLIEECYKKYDVQVSQKQQAVTRIAQKCIELQDMQKQFVSLQRIVNSTREVSVGLIKQNQNLKAQIIIEKEKYQILLQDYDSLTAKYQKELRLFSQQNRALQRKVDEMDVQIKIYQKDKEIQKLLVYQDSIHKRQKQTLNIDQNSASSSSHKYHKYGQNHSPYQYLPRRLNFQDGGSMTKKEQSSKRNKQNQSNANDIIQLQRNKIINLENQLKILQNRNKELQNLMVKFMK